MNNIIDLLNLKERDIESLNIINEKDNTKTFRIKLKNKQHNCPICNSINIKVNQYYKRLIKHPILNNMGCKIDYLCRRFQCNNCHYTFNELNPFVSYNKTYSDYTRELVLTLLKDPHQTFKSIAEKTNLSLTTIINIFDELGDIQRKELSSIICIDEYYDPSTGIGKYNLVLLDFISKEIIDILPDRTKYFVQNYLTKIPQKERLNVKHISIDMWKPYKDLAKIYFKNAIISVDPFHVTEHIIKALNKIKVRTLKQLEKHTNEFYLLNNFNYLLFKNYDDLKEYEPKLNRKLNLYLNSISTLELILQINDQLTYAYNFKERYHRFNTDYDSIDKEEELDILIFMSKKSEIDELIEVGKTLENWKIEIINSFTFYNKRRITNALIESKNALIKTLINNANGFVNFKRERNRLMYCNNKNIRYK